MTRVIGKTPSRKRLLKIFYYDEPKGIFFWKVRSDRTLSWNSRFAGKQAGMVAKDGYVYIKIDAVRYTAHRLIWKITHNKDIPEIDHKNGDNSDNRIVNLRAATRAENCQNQKIRNDSGSGFKGVTFYKPTGCWRAEVKANKKRHYLGQFPTAEEAHAAYLQAAITVQKEFAVTQRYRNTIERANA